MQAVQHATNNATGAFTKFQAKLISLNQGIQLIQQYADALSRASEPGLKLNASMQDLSAITGVTGQKLKEIEGYARSAAKIFGGDAANSVESYKLLLSQLSPEIAKVPAALASMGNSASILSKTLNNDIVAATEVLTTAMNQYQISLQDPITASRDMANMMNIMAAAAQEGSAELPQIKQALEQAGMAAKMAGVSFAETNAAIQILDKAGKKGAEGGVAIRNVLATLSEGRFLPKLTIAALREAGVNIETLSNESMPLADRLKELKKIMSDSAIVTQLFGKENSNAARALIAGIPEMERLTQAIQGTKSAEEQAAIVMQSKEEQLARIRAKMDDYKIAIFNATGNLMPFATIAASVLVPLAQMGPLLTGIYNVIKGFSFTKIIAGFTAFKISAITSCRAVGIAIMNIPVFGWIAAAIAALVAAFTLLWNKSEGFRKAVLGVWEVVKKFAIALYDSIVGVIKNIISGVSSLASAFGKLFKLDFSGAWQDAKDGIQKLAKANPITIWTEVASADYSGAWNTGKQKGSESWSKSHPDSKEVDAATGSIISYNQSVQDTNTNVNKSLSISKEYAEIIKKLQAQLGSITETNKLWGTEQEAVTDKIEAIKAAITDLTQNGFTANSKEIKGLLFQLTELNNKQRDLQIELQQTTFKANLLSTAFNKLKSNKIKPPDFGNMEIKDINSGIKIIADMNKKQKDAIILNGIYGESNDLISEKISNVKAAISSLIAAGYSPASREVQKLSGVLVQLKSDLNLSKTINETFGSSASETLSIFGQNIASVGGAFRGAAGEWIQFAGNIISAIPKLIAQVAAFSAAYITAKQAETTANSSAAISGAVAGANTIPYPWNLIAMAASIAATIAALATSVPKMANGGIVSGPTMLLAGEYPGASNNPEVIAPLNKLQDMIKPAGLGGQVIFRIERNELVGILDSYYKDRKYM